MTDVNGYYRGRHADRRAGAAADAGRSSRTARSKTGLTRVALYFGSPAAELPERNGGHRGQPRRRRLLRHVRLPACALISDADAQTALGERERPHQRAPATASAAARTARAAAVHHVRLAGQHADARRSEQLRVRTSSRFRSSQPGGCGGLLTLAVVNATPRNAELYNLISLLVLRPARSRSVLRARGRPGLGRSSRRGVLAARNPPVPRPAPTSTGTYSHLLPDEPCPGTPAVGRGREHPGAPGTYEIQAVTPDDDLRQRLHPSA